MSPKAIRYAAGLTNYMIAKDPVTRLNTPRLKDNPGQVHAVYIDARRPAMQEPFFIEDTQHYRAAICGQLIRVIMPLSFKATEDNVCKKCAEEMQNVDITQPLKFRGIVSEQFHLNWRPRWVRKTNQAAPTGPSSTSENT